ncbi:hypothetical protein V1264_011457 [Littorina saxatilis]|uniref:Uncharacterized protein n=1 Tax=Littorina saxatilis TaxID=31220 RepID=A0AAN9GKY9_9CAEN
MAPAEQFWLFSNGICFDVCKWYQGPSPCTYLPGSQQEALLHMTPTPEHGMEPKKIRCSAGLHSCTLIHYVGNRQNWILHPTVTAAVLLSAQVLSRSAHMLIH